MWVTVLATLHALLFKILTGMLLGDYHCYCHFIDGEMATQKNEILAQGQYARNRRIRIGI